MPIVPLVGRDGDVSRFIGLLEAGAQLVTLCGPAGIGKTRLVRACLPPSVVAGFADTVACELAAIGDRDGLAAAVADALGLRVERGTTDAVVDQLGRALAARGRIVVALDHADAIAGDVRAVLARWLAAAPEVAFLVTARAALGLADELVYDV